MSLKYFITSNLRCLTTVKNELTTNMIIGMHILNCTCNLSVSLSLSLSLSLHNLFLYLLLYCIYHDILLKSDKRAQGRLVPNQLGYPLKIKNLLTYLQIFRLYCIETSRV